MRALFAKFVTAVIGAGLMMTATAALACNTGGCAPPPPPVRPMPPTPPSMPCNSCGGGGSNSNSGANASASANVNVNVNVNASASGSAGAFGFGFGQSYASGGGYGNWSQTPGPVENAGGLNIETGAGGAAFDMITDRRSMTRTIVIQASCFDDTGVPHPASQLSADRAIANEYIGEVYRCIAGTHMSVTMADLGICDDFGGAAGETRVSESETSSYSHSESHSESGYSDAGYDGPGAGPCSPQALACSNGHGRGYAGGGESRDEHVVVGGPRGARCAANMDFNHINFDGGKTMTCQKGDALWFEHGNMTCKAQIPQRQCNERSLLRRFGVGLKVLTITRVETMHRQVARQIERSSSSSTVMTFNGGVGGFVE